MKIGRLFWSACPFRQPPRRFRGAWGMALWSPGLTHRRYQQAIRIANTWRPTLMDLARVGVESEP